MTLQQKTILGISLLFGAFALAISFISATLLSKSYSEIEHDQAYLQVRYLHDGFDQIGRDLDSFTTSAAKWSDTAKYINNPAAANSFTRVIAANTLAPRRISLFILADVDGSIRHEVFTDIQDQNKALKEDNFKEIIAAVRHNFIAGTPRSMKGLVRIKGADLTLFIQAEPVFDAEKNLPIGIVAVGRAITEADIMKLKGMVQATNLEFYYTGEGSAAQWDEANYAFAKGEDSLIKTPTDNIISTYVAFRDLDSKPLLNIRVDNDRTYFQRGRYALRIFTVITIIFGFCAVFLFYIFLERQFMWRIRLLGSQLATIRRKKNSTLRLTVTGKDELGTLTEDINQTLLSLDDEQKQREQAQREHKVIVDSLKEVIFRIDTNGKWTYLNPAWKDLTGYSERETLEQYFGKSIYTEDLATAQELVDSLIEGQVESGNIEVRYHTKSGAVRWVQLFARTIRNDKSEVTGLTGTLFDVTERISAEKRLRESEQLYRLVSENSTDVIFRLTLQGDILYTSRASVAVLGYTPEELRNTWIYDYCHPDDSLRVQKAYQKILEKGITSTIEHQIRQKNGTYLWVESVGKPITDQNGKPITDESGRLMELIVTTRDITERKHNESILQLREKALASASCGVLIADAVKADYPITYANKEFERMTGYSTDDWLGKHTFFLGGPLTDKAKVETIEKALKEASEVDAILLCYRKDGTTFWSRIAIAPLYDKNGHLTHYISVLTDISDIKTIQDELEKAKNAAEEANKAKSSFLAMMSHEIRTPMNAVIGFAELLSNTPLNEEQREYLGTINSSANALLAIINDILDFSKIEANKLELDPQPSVLSQIIEEAVMLVKPKADAKGLKLAYNIDPLAPAIVIVDGVRLRQVLLNLLSNASKFTQKGSITVNVRHEAIDLTAARLHFEVIDTGIGIPEDRIGKLFQSFTQVDSSTTRKYGGTGLGLAISKKFCELMDGKIAVTSTYGKGSSFKFDIKVAIDQELLQMPTATTVTSTTVAPLTASKAPMTKQSKSPFSKPTAHTDEQPYRLLVVEDNPANQLVLLKMLCQMNLTADVANHGKEALELWSKQSYHIVLTDLQMPEMDGIELTKCIRDREKSQSGAPTHIIGVTANVLPEHREKCLNAGMDDFLTKPLKMEALKRALQKYQPSKV